MSLKLDVLILEDSDADARLLVRTLTKEGNYEVTHERVESRNALKAALDKRKWDIVISDHSMPQFSAITALQEIKDRKLDIPVIILSGTIEPSEAVAVMRAGASDYIMKDDTTRLLPVIERELRESRSRGEKRAVEYKLQQAQKLDSIGRLAGGVAHDFNNILTAISGYSHFILNSLPPNDAIREDVLEIRKAGERAAALTRQLLAFSRQQVLKPRVLDLNVLVTEMEKMLRRIVGENMGLASVLAENLGRINADPGQIEQILLNLAVNARDAMPQGGKITIETGNTELSEEYARTHPEVRPGPHVMLAVSDTGIGMPPAVMARLFEPFFTTKEQGKGTGLGLSTVYGIVKQSGGSISVHSQEGHGSVFKIFLPTVQNALSPAHKATSEPGDNFRGTETILLAEDDDAVRKYTQRLLAQNGYVVLEARNAEEALQVAKSHANPIHLLIADLVMTGLRGDDLAKQLAVTRPEMKIILTSGYTEAGVVRHDLLSSKAQFIQKPVDPVELNRMIRTTLDRPKGKP